MTFSLPLPTDFFDRNVESVVADLLGKLLFRRSRAGLTVGRIVETEAYLAAGDTASHSFRGISRKNASMFGPPGRAYVYTIHARQCLNVVTEPSGTASAVLIRAVEPVAGVPLMSRRRGTEVLRDLCRGPGRLCEAFDIPRKLDGWPISSGQRLWIADESAPAPSCIARSVRIGVTSAHHEQLRFFLPDCPFVSGPKSLNVMSH